MDADIKHVMQFFDHLPQQLQKVSRPFGELAQQLVTTADGSYDAVGAVLAALPDNRERAKAVSLVEAARSAESRIAALDHLLAAKDAAVRARLAKEA